MSRNLWRYFAFHTRIYMKAISSISRLVNDSEMTVFFLFPKTTRQKILGETDYLIVCLMQISYSTVLLSSLYVNSVIIHIRTDTSMKTASNYLILNQACADLLVGNSLLFLISHSFELGNLWFGRGLGQATCSLLL